MRKARGLFPVKTAEHLVEITGYSLRSCAGWLAGEGKIPADALASLIRSEWGVEFLAAVMADAQPRWWQWAMRLLLAASARRAQQRYAKLIRDAFDANADLSETIARADAALFHAEDAGGQGVGGIGAMALVVHRAVAEKGKSPR